MTHTQSRREQVNPNEGFRKQLEEFEEQIFKK